MEDLVTMSTNNTVENGPILKLNYSSCKNINPLIVDIDTMRINFTNNNFNSLERYLRSKDMIQSTYEEAIKTSQRFVIPKLEEMKRQYYPSCCNNDSKLENICKKGKNHFEYKIIQLLNSLQNYLDHNIEITRRVLEIKLV